jgi:hypothetical protein
VSRISDLQACVSITGSEKIPCAYGEANVAITPNQLRSFVGAGGGGGGGVSGTTTWDQMIASSTWVVNHGLNSFPSVTVVDSSGATVEGAVEYDDANSLTISFSAAFAGTAYLN